MIETLVRKENETKKNHTKRIEKMVKPFNCYPVIGDNPSAKIDRRIILRVTNKDVNINDKLTVFTTVSPKVANKEVLKVLDYLDKDSSELKEGSEKELFNYKYRGYKTFNVGNYTVEVLAEKIN